MDKSDLREVATKLASAEFLCKTLNKILSDAQDGSDDKQIHKNLEAALVQVKELTLEANRIRLAIPELAGKRYWWDVPFTVQEPSFEDTFCFDDGIYIESDKIDCVFDERHWYVKPKKETVGYDLLSSQLTNRDTILFYLNRKELLNKINSCFEMRYIYNVMSVTRQYEVVSYLNPSISPVSLALREYEQQREMLLQEQDIELGKSQQEHDKRWDLYEMISHGSLMTNEERWLYGKMSNERYFNEKVMRDYYGDDKVKKIKEAYNSRILDIRNRSQTMQQLAQRNYVKSKTSVAGEANIIRTMPVGEVYYCNDEIIAILTYKEPQQITEYDCDSNVTLTELNGKYYTRKFLFDKVPAPAPLARYIAMQYSADLPKYNVLGSCPKGCPDELWRVWAEIRFLTAIENTDAL